MINFIVAPLVMTWLLAYFISSMFSEIFRWVALSNLPPVALPVLALATV